MAEAGCHVTGLSHLGGRGSIPDQSMWDLWWTEYHWDMFYPAFFGFTVLLSFHCGALYSCIFWGMNNRPVGGRS
jgi:hypothetical protein